MTWAHALRAHLTLTGTAVVVVVVVVVAPGRPTGFTPYPTMVILLGLHLRLAGNGYTLYPERFPRGVTLHLTLPILRTPPVKGATKSVAVAVVSI